MVRVIMTLVLVGIRACQRIKISKKHMHTRERQRQRRRYRDRQTQTDSLEKLCICEGTKVSKELGSKESAR